MLDDVHECSLECAFCMCRVKLLLVCAQPIQSLQELNEIYCKTEKRRIMFAGHISFFPFLHIYLSFDIFITDTVDNGGVDLQVVFIMVFDFLGHLEIVPINKK